MSFLRIPRIPRVFRIFLLGNVTIIGFIFLFVIVAFIPIMNSLEDDLDLSYVPSIGLEIYEDAGIFLPLDPPFLLTSPFGPRWGAFHYGVDLTAGFGAPVRTVMDGIVIRAVDYFYCNDGHLLHPFSFGNVIFILHPTGVVTVYSHLRQQLMVSVGDVVQGGQIIGFEGNSGRSTGSHLHFEWRENGRPIDPELRIDFRYFENFEMPEITDDEMESN